MKAFSLYKSYSENNNYVPDLVICTRPDVVLSLNKRCFYKIIELLDIVCYEDTSNIVSSEVRTVKGQGWVQDYAFITNIKGADDFLGGDPEKRLLDLTFNHRSRTTGLLDSSGLQAHMLWPILGHKCTFVEASFFLSTLVRREFSNNDFINISQKKIFKQINCELLQWFEIKKPDYPLSTETLLNEIRRINA